MTPDLTERQRRILARLVGEYIEQGEPVSSAWLAEHSALGVSSASSLSLIVIKAESVYVVNDPSRRAGEWVLSNVFNLQFERLQGFLY